MTPTEMCAAAVWKQQCSTQYYRRTLLKKQFFRIHKFTAIVNSHNGKLMQRLILGATLIARGHVSELLYRVRTPFPVSIYTSLLTMFIFYYISKTDGHTVLG